MKFGLNQFGKATPDFINNLFDAISAGLGIVAGFFAAASFISHSISDVVVTIINLLLIPLVPIVKRLFGGTTTPPADGGGS